MSELMMVIEWAEEHFEICEIQYDRGCHCYDWRVIFEYEEYTCEVRGIGYLDGDLSDRGYISNDYDGREEFEYRYPTGKIDDLLDRVKEGFIELVDDDVTFCL